MEITGGCVCGGTRYLLKSASFSLGDCHCIDCRRSAGAPYVTWGSVPREDLVVTRGEPRKISYVPWVTIDESLPMFQKESENFRHVKRPPKAKIKS